MKLLLSIALFIATASAAASSACMYCRRLDQGAGLLVTFSYCNQTDICLQNAWNYITRDCQGGWVRGNSYELDFCQPDEISRSPGTTSPVTAKEVGSEETHMSLTSASQTKS